MLLLNEVARPGERASLALDEATLEGSLQGTKIFSDDMAINGKVRSRHVPDLEGPARARIPTPAALALLHKATRQRQLYSLKGRRPDACRPGRGPFRNTHVTGLVTLDIDGKPDDPLHTGRRTAPPTGSLDLDKLFRPPEQSPASEAATEQPVLPARKPGRTCVQLELNLKLRAKQADLAKNTPYGCRPAPEDRTRPCESEGRRQKFLPGLPEGRIPVRQDKTFAAADPRRREQRRTAAASRGRPLADRQRRCHAGRPNFSGNTLGQIAESLQAGLHSSLTSGSFSPDASGTTIWPFSKLKYDLEASAQHSDKNVVRPFAIRTKVNYKGLPPWLQAPRKNPKDPKEAVLPVLEGTPEASLNADIKGNARFSLADLALRNLDNASTRVSYKGLSGNELNYREIATDGSCVLNYDVLFDTLDLKKIAFSALGFDIRGDTHCTGLSGPAKETDLYRQSFFERRQTPCGPAYVSDRAPHSALPRSVPRLEPADGLPAG